MKLGPLRVSDRGRRGIFIRAAGPGFDSISFLQHHTIVLSSSIDSKLQNTIYSGLSPNLNQQSWVGSAVVGLTSRSTVRPSTGLTDSLHRLRPRSELSAIPRSR